MRSFLLLLLSPAVVLAESMSCQEVVATKLLYNGQLIAQQLQPNVLDFKEGKMDWSGSGISTFHQSPRFKTYAIEGVTEEQSQGLLKTFLFTFGEGKETLVKVSRKLPTTSFFNSHGNWAKGELAEIQVKMPLQRRHYVGKEVSTFQNSKVLSWMKVVPGPELSADVKDNAFYLKAPFAKDGDSVEYRQEYAIDCGKSPELETTIQVFNDERGDGKTSESVLAPPPPPPPPPVKAE